MEWFQASSPPPPSQIKFPNTFRYASNYLIEMLTIKMVDFFRPYHIILGQSCYIKLMVIPSYAYLKLKISGLAGIITVDAKAK
jgi:hypothetical protein